MALELVGGAALGTVFGALYDVVKVAIGSTNIQFKPVLRDLKFTLDSLRPRIIQQIRDHNFELGLPNDDIESLQQQMEKGAKLVAKLSKLGIWSCTIWCSCCNCTNPSYTDQLVELDRSLRILLEILKLQEARDMKEALLLARKIHDKQDDLDKRLAELLKVQEEAGNMMRAHLERNARESSGSNTQTTVQDPSQGNGAQGATLKTVFGVLFGVVIQVKDKTRMFKRILGYLKSTLDSLKPFIEEIGDCNTVLHLPKEELENFVIQIEKGVELVCKCSKVRRWASYQKYEYTNKLLGLDESLQRLLYIMRVQLARDLRESLVSINNSETVIKQIEECNVVQNDQIASKAWCSVHEPPSATIGLDVVNVEEIGEMIKEGEPSLLGLYVEGPRDAKETLHSATDMEAEGKQVEGPSVTLGMNESLKSQQQQAPDFNNISRPPIFPTEKAGGKSEIEFEPIPRMPEDLSFSFDIATGLDYMQSRGLDGASKSNDLHCTQSSQYGTKQYSDEIGYRENHNHPKPQSTTQSTFQPLEASSHEISDPPVPTISNPRIESMTVQEDCLASIREDDLEQNPLFSNPEGSKARRREGENANDSTLSDSRVSFRTKTKLDLLDDGFKWRKYGKKLVKGNPNPRNYYKCSVVACPVKKRVERESHEYVITTYQGVHNHAAPAAPGSSTVFNPRLASIGLDVLNVQETREVEPPLPAVGLDVLNVEGTRDAKKTLDSAVESEAVVQQIEGHNHRKHPWCFSNMDSMEQEKESLKSQQQQAPDFNRFSRHADSSADYSVVKSEIEFERLLSDTGYDSDSSSTKMEDILSLVQSDDGCLKYARYFEKDLAFLSKLGDLPWKSQCKVVEDVENHLKCSPQASYSMESQNFVEPLVKFLEDAHDRDDIKAQRDGLKSLLTFVSKNRNGILYLREEAYSLLASYLHSEVTEEALFIMEVVSGDKYCRSKISESGALLSIVKFLLDSQLQGSALKVLSNLSLSRDICSKIVSLEFIPKMLPLFNDPTLTGNCISILKNLCETEEGRISIAETDGCIGSVVGVLDNDSSECQEHAVSILLSLCSQHVEYRHLAMREGVVPALVFVAHNGKEKARASAAEVLRLLRDIDQTDVQEYSDSDISTLSEPGTSTSKNKSSRGSGFFGKKMSMFSKLSWFAHQEKK